MSEFSLIWIQRMILYRIVFFPPAVIRNRSEYKPSTEVNWLDKMILWGLGGGITLLFSQEVWKTEVCKKKKKKKVSFPPFQFISIYKMLNTLCLSFKDACETHYGDTLGGWKINLSDFYIMSAEEGMRLDSHFLSRSMHSRSLCARVTVFLFDHLLFSLYCISICSSPLVLIYFLRTKSPRPNFLPKLFLYCSIIFLQR